MKNKKSLIKNIIILAVLIVAALYFKSAENTEDYDASAKTSIVETAVTTPDGPTDGPRDNQLSQGQPADPGTMEKTNKSSSKKDTEVEIVYEFRNRGLLEEHFEKHGQEFPYNTKEEYLAGANIMMANPAKLHKTEKEDGDDVYYLEETNEFIIVSGDGYLRTYFKPSKGKKYFDRQ